MMHAHSRIRMMARCLAAAPTGFVLVFLLSVLSLPTISIAADVGAATGDMPAGSAFRDCLDCPQIIARIQLRNA